MSYQIKREVNVNGESKLYKISRVRDLPSEERPREKLLEHGPTNLSSAELLAIVLGVGTKKEEVYSMSLRTMREYGEKGIAYQKDPNAIKRDLDIPITKACQIVACFELGRRFYEKKPGSLAVIRTAKQAYEHLKDMSKHNKEQIRVLYLNNHYQLIHDEVVSIGTIDAAILEPRDVFQPAIEHGALAVIVAHNHPSGILKANKTDAEITDKLIAAGKILDIELLDHLVIANDKFISIV